MAGSTTNLSLVKPTYAESQDVTVLNGNFDLIDAEAGKVRENFAGAYSSSQAYAVGDYCTYQGNLYRCTTAIGSSGEAWTSGHWTQVAVGDELSSLSEQIATSSTMFTPLVGSATTAVKYRNFYVTNNNHDYVDIHFCLIGGTFSTTAVNIMTLPDWAKNKTIQYSVGYCNGESIMVYNSGDYLQAYSKTSITATGNDPFSGSIHIDCVTIS